MKNTRKRSRPYPDDAWESGKLGRNPAFVRKVPEHVARRIDDALGLQLISIRFQKELLTQLKELAEEEGIGYQPYIRQVLTRHVRDAFRDSGRRRKKLRIIKDTKK